MKKVKKILIGGLIMAFICYKPKGSCSFVLITDKILSGQQVNIKWFAMHRKIIKNT